MLNRLFIAIGVLVILAIGAAFVVPSFIQWGDYRGRLQTMAAQAFGTQVAIEGDIHLTLLPQPKLEFTKVRVGPVSAPVLEVAQVDAEFSLLDFLRDQYKVTGLTLDHPVLNFAIGPDGTFTSGLSIAGGAGASNVSIANADVVGGTLRVIDGRSAKTYVADGINGQLKLDALEGPFNFQGTASVEQVGYGVRVGTGTLDASGSTMLSVYIKANDDSFTLESNGAITAGATPKYTGDLTYRRPPPKPRQGEAVDAGRGDFVLTGKLSAAPDRVLLSDYTALPDENRAATRLTGAAELKVGKDTAFNAIVSGGVVALPPRDATKELADPPYELVRLLGETPLPFIPPLPGTIGLDITELNLRAVTLRDVRLEAATDTRSWTVKSFSASLPGATKMGLTGNLSVVDGKPIFAGNLSLDSQQLDRLAALWRKPPDGNPLFNKAGTLTADVALSPDTLTLSPGTLVVGGVNQGFDATIGFGVQRSLKLDAHFTTLGEDESTTIGALLPDVTTGGSFGGTFPKGEIDLSASKAVLFGLDGTTLSADATWDGGVLEFSKLSAADLGGASFDAKLTAFGTLAKPELSGNASLKLENDAPAVTTLLGALHTPPAVAIFIERSLPADLSLQLDAPAGDGGQTLSVSGKLGTADTKLQAKLGAGIAAALSSPISASLDLQSDSPRMMTKQLGLGETELLDNRTPLHLLASVDGVPSNSYETHVVLTGGDDSITFDGNVIPGDFTSINGDGHVDVKLGDPSALVAELGAAGVYLPGLEGGADVHFAGPDTVSLSGISANGATGSLAMSRQADRISVTGSLAIPSLDVKALLPALAGAAGTVADPGSLWPMGPIDIGQGPRSSDGRIDVSVADMPAGGAPFLKDANFGLDWDAQSVHLRSLSGSTGGGTLTFDAMACCSSATQPVKQVSGRASLSGVALSAVAPAIGASLGGTLDGSAEFNGTGASLGEVIQSLSGTGSYTINGFTAAHLDPAVFGEVAGLTGIVDTTPEALSQTILDKLGAAPFNSPSATGTLSIAGGVVRSPNLAIAGAAARLFGDATLSLKDLSLGAHYALSPTGLDPNSSAIDPATAEIDVAASGPLWAPVGSYDVSSLVSGMKIKASEVELARLQKLKDEADARAKAAAEADARLAVIRPGLKIAAGGEAMQAAVAAAARKAAADAAAQKASSSQAAQNDLGL